MYELRSFRNSCYILALTYAFVCIFDLFLHPFPLSWHYPLHRITNIILLIAIAQLVTKKKLEKIPEYYYELIAYCLFYHSLYGMLYIAPAYTFSFMMSYIIIGSISKISLKRFIRISIVGIILSGIGHYLAELPRFINDGYDIRIRFWFICLTVQIISILLWVFNIRIQHQLDELNERYLLIGKQSAFLLHEIKDPIIRAYTYSQSSSDDTNISKINKEMIKTIALIKSLESLIFKKGIAKNAFTSLKMDEIRDLIIEEFTSLCESNNIRLEFKDHTTRLEGDKNLIYHMIKNLVINAIEAIGHQSDEAPTISINTISLDKHSIIQVKNTHSHVDASVFEKLFNPMFTTKKAEENRGLGLAIVKEIVDLHRGKIDVTSLNNETTFTITIPNTLFDA